MTSKFTVFLPILFLVFFKHQIFAQQINPKILEVYGDKTQEILQNDPEHFLRLTDLINNRIKITQTPHTPEEKYIKLSSVGLLSKYNSALKRDLNYDPNTFNPLKYDLDFFPTTAQVYRIDNTDFLIVITPQSLTK